jgi:hypothetical protein
MSWGMADLRTVCRIVLVSEARLRALAAISHHLLRGDLGLLGLAGDKGRARHGRWADSRGRAESGPREGTEEAGVHGGLSGLRVSALRGRANSQQTACEGGCERTRQGIRRPWR